MSKKNIKFTFNPHLIPTFRGILTTIYVELNKKSSSNKIRNELVKFYKKDKIVSTVSVTDLQAKVP